MGLGEMGFRPARTAQPAPAKTTRPAATRTEGRLTRAPPQSTSSPRSREEMREALKEKNEKEKIEEIREAGERERERERENNLMRQEREI